MHPLATLKRRTSLVLRDPAALYRFARQELRRHLRARRIEGVLRRPRADLRLAVERTPPIAVPVDGPVVVHMLCGTAGVIDALAALKSLYRFLDAPLPIILHEDGTLTAADRALLCGHFPGLRIVTRAEADAIIDPMLVARGLERCRQLRSSVLLALKLFDLQYFAGGRRVLYLDSDILFLARPVEILEALAAPDDAWRDRYNQDVKPCLTWPPEAVEAHLGVRLASSPLNSGLMCLRYDDLDWAFYERCLEMPGRDWWVEQSLYAIDLARRGAVPLGPVYDVCFRCAWAGHVKHDCIERRWHGRPVVTEHYCGGLAYRQLFYERANMVMREITAPGSP